MKSTLRLLRGPWLRPVLALLAVLASAGCAGTPLGDPLQDGPFYQPRNFAGETELPAKLRRVVLLPVCVGRVAPEETAASLDEALFVALQRQMRFEVVALSREESLRWFGAPEFPSSAALPHGYVAKVAAKFGADAVVFVDLTAYRAYRPLAVGFRAKLVDAGEVRILWTFDELIAADAPGVANSARKQFLQADRSGQPLDLSQTVLQSPSRFALFAAGAMFTTLPPR